MDADRPSNPDYSVHYLKAHSARPENREAQIEAIQSRLASVLERCQRGRAVDVGSGLGFAVLALGRLGFDAVGFERDKALIDAARSLGAAVVETGDLVSELRCMESELTVVVMMDVLEHLPPPDQLDVLRAAHAAMAPGARLVVQVPNASSPVAAHRRYGDWTHTSSFTDRSLEFLLTSAGFDEPVLVSGPSTRRPPLRFWKRSSRVAFRRWAVHAIWRQVILSELGPELGGVEPPLGTDMMAVARRA